MNTPRAGSCIAREVFAFGFQNDRGWIEKAMCRRPCRCRVIAQVFAVTCSTLLLGVGSGKTECVASTPAVAALDAANIAYGLHQYEHDTTASSYGTEAAELLGLEPARVFKTLVASTGSDLVVAVVPVAAMLDLRALASAVSAKRAAMADPKEAERATGYVLGGISPLGQKRRLTTVIDVSVETWPTIYCSGGRRGLEIEIDPSALVSLLGATLAPIAKLRD